MSQKRAGRPRLRFRLTSRGAGLALLSPLVAFVGLQLGSTDFVALGTALAAVVVVASALAILAPRDVRLVRSVPRDEVRDGQTAHVVYDLQARRPGLWPIKGTAELIARGGTEPEPLAITGVQVNRPTTVRFEALPRGLFTLGPGWILRSDPMGLAQRIQDIPGSEALRVWPRSVAVPAPWLPGLSDMGRPSSYTSEGYEFRQLREFVTGDDRRRIHWPSSAKRDVLLVRETQDDESSQVSIVLDCRADTYSERDPEPGSLVRSVRHPGFELAVSVAASLVESYVRNGLVCSLDLASPGRPTVRVDSAAMLGRALDALAETNVADAGDSELVEVLTPDRATRSSALVLITGTPDAVVAEGLNRARAGHRNRLLLTCDEFAATDVEGNVALSAEVSSAGVGRAPVRSLALLADGLGEAMAGSVQTTRSHAASRQQGEA